MTDVAYWWGVDLEHGAFLSIGEPKDAPVYERIPGGVRPGETLHVESDGIYFDLKYEDALRRAT